MTFNPYSSLGGSQQLSLSGTTDPYAAGGLSSAGMYQPSFNGGGGGDDIRTIFITGFPPDVKERELNNLLRFLPGYKASQMNWKNGQAQGFALFDNTIHARQSIEHIGQLMFDENHVLRCEMARKNMYVKDDTPSDPLLNGHTYLPSGLSAQQQQQILNYSGNFGGMPMASSTPMGLAAPTPTPAPTRPQSYGQVTNMRDNPPCNTLFVGNMSDNVDENELRNLFSSQPGFRQMKLVHGDKGANCFVEFADEQSAIYVHRQQQGAILGSSDRGPIRIQFSKNPFGQKRDPNATQDVSLQSIMGGHAFQSPYLAPSPRFDSMGLSTQQQHQFYPTSHMSSPHPSS